MRNIIITTCFMVSTFSISSCSWVPDLSDIGLPRVHKIDVRQGNIVEQEQINQLRPGMSKQQVTFIMGTPMLDDSFHANRWDYLYRFKPGYGEATQKQASLYFDKEGKLNRIQGTFRPGDKAEKIHNTTEVIVVPLDKYNGDDVAQKSYWQRLVDFFSWTDEHEGIPSDGDAPVGARGEGELSPNTMDSSAQNSDQ